MSFLKFIAFFVVSLSLIAIINCAEFSNCPADARYGKLNKIVVTNCSENDLKCPFTVGQNVSMQLTFESSKFLIISNN